MGRAYSTDLRERVVKLRAEGYTQLRIAQVLGMSLNTVKRYLVRYQTTGSVAPKVGKGKPSSISAEARGLLNEQVVAHSSWSLKEHATAFGAAIGRTVSHMTIHRLLKQMGFTRKKRQWVRVNGI